MDFDEDLDYLDLDDILAQTQTVDCKFLINIPELKFLSPGEDRDDTLQGSKTLLPFWMAKNLYTYSMIDIEVPKHYNVGFRETLKAEADVVDLHRAGPHYYDFGKLLMGLRRERGNNLPAFTEEGQRNKYRREEGESLVDKREVATSLLETFHQRRHKILLYSTNKSPEEFHSVKALERRLDNMEKRLFQLGRQHVEELKDWDSRRIETIRRNIIAHRLNKRRKLEM